MSREAPGRAPLAGGVARVVTPGCTWEPARPLKEGPVDITILDKTNEKVRLGDFSEAPPKGVERSEAKKELEELGEELFDLQDLLWGARMSSVLIVLQGRDTAGKDGTIKNVA